MRNSTIRSILAPSPNRLLRRDDLMYEYGLPREAAYEILRGYGIQIKSRLYIKRTVLEKALEGKTATN